MSNTSYKDYWKNVRAIAKEKADKKFGFGLRLLLLIGGFISTTIVSWVWGSSPMKAIILALYTAIANAIFWIIVWLGYFVYYRANESVIIHDSQVGTIEDFTQKWGGIRIPTTNIALRPQEDKDGDNLVVWLRVENGEVHDLEDCYADLRVVMVKNSDKWKDVTTRVIRTSSKLIWPKNGEGKITVRREPNWERINIATMNINVHGGKQYFTFSGATNNSASDVFEEEIYIEIALNGTMQGKPIEEVPFKGFVKSHRKSVRKYVPENKSPPLYQTEIDKFFIEEGFLER